MTGGQIVDLLNRLSSYYGPQKWWESENPVLDLLSMVLIQRTTEQNALRALASFSQDISLEELAAMPLETLQEAIRPAGFFQQKSRTIQALADCFLSSGLAELEQLENEQLRKLLLGIKGIGPETADVILLYIFKRRVFIADQYAIRLFERLGIGRYKDYESMRQACQHLTLEVSQYQCREWHAAIDQHGKAYRQAKGQLDESWLLDF